MSIFMIDELYLNYYQEPQLGAGGESYRLTWQTMNAFDVCVRLSIEDGKFSCVSKQIRVVDDKVELAVNTISEVPKHLGLKFVSSIEENDLWNYTPTGNDGIDGSFWTLELSAGRRYRIITEYLPTVQNPVRMIGERLLEFSTFEFGPEDIY